MARRQSEPEYHYMQLNPDLDQAISRLEWLLQRSDFVQRKFQHKDVNAVIEAVLFDVIKDTVEANNKRVWRLSCSVPLRDWQDDRNLSHPISQQEALKKIANDICNSVDTLAKSEERKSKLSACADAELNILGNFAFTALQVVADAHWRTFDRRLNESSIMNMLRLKIDRQLL